MLRPIAEGLWSHRTHLRSRGPLWVPRTMSVVAVGDGLLLHSPNDLTPSLHAALAELGLLASRHVPRRAGRGRSGATLGCLRRLRPLPPVVGCADPNRDAKAW
ncbi:MAG: hypothetical protein JKY65_28680 [Planctomycetes bacterium]|nr:hypothetical protein [Planctomycetota bacterium]